MDDSVEFYTAFRVFGSFHWPPVAGSHLEENLKDGVVEILYVKDPDKPNLCAFLRWQRRPSADESLIPFALKVSDLPTVPYVHALSAADLVKDFGKDAIVLLRLDGDAAGSVSAIGERLVFRGARVFDQFALTRAKADPDRRWVLARQYIQDKNPLFSELICGDPSDDPKKTGLTIRFNLALPTIIPQAIVKAVPVRVLPFSVTYASVIPPPAGVNPLPLAIKKFRAGSIELPDKEIDPAQKVAQAWIGGFGFARSGNKPEFLAFPVDGSNPEQFWLQDRKLYRDKLLERLGDTSHLDSDDFRFFYEVEGGDDPLGARWNSVTFPSNAPSRMVFRSAIVAKTHLFPPDKGDIVTDLGPYFKIRNPDQPSQLIRAGSNLFVELDLDYDLIISDVWNVGQGAVGNPTVTIRLGFERDVDKNPGAGSLETSPSPPPPVVEVSRFFADSIRGMRLARIDLKNVASAQPESILPDVANLIGKDLRFALTAGIEARFDADGMLDWGSRPTGTAWSGADLRLTLWPKGRFIAGEPPSKLTALIAPYSFAYPGSQNVSQFEVEIDHDPAAASGTGTEFCQFRIAPPAPKAAKALMGRLGGLEFKTKPDRYLFDETYKGDRATDYSYWRFGQRVSIGDQADKTLVYYAASLDFRLRLEITSVTPLGVDIPWWDRTGRPRPLLIPIAGKEDGAGRFILDIRERISDGADRLLTARLLDTGDGSATGLGEFVVLSEEPHAIGKFRSAALANRGAADNAIVAAFDSDTRSWQLKLVSKHYHYEFPPQVVGESMDKPRRLEIIDQKDGETPPLPPFDPAKDGLQRRAVEFRLSPSAEIWIEPSDVLRGYFLPEWASYEIFRQSGAFGLGAALAALRGEFLYGLAVGVDVSRETGMARGARIAEIEALTGRPPGAPNAANIDPMLASRWNGVSRAIARRPERLEVWNRDLSNPTAFAPARFESGVAFALRNTAVHRPAVAEAKIRNLPRDGLPRSRDYGLSGGALWPVESANLFNRLLEKPASDGGTIERIALSPGGGDADQKAEFLNQQVAIISETRNGFVQRHKVEVIGRIAVFWHRAKHVVVYERTVNPTAQFSPEDPLGARTRRPVLRKVSEYVELLQPVRQYPDFPSAKPATSGFLSAVRFNAKTINVDSAWSEDVDTYGWKIPLWNRDSARKRPQVYPRPDIAFVTHAEGESEQPIGAQECLEPDNLYFVADFETGGNDTDAWQPRLGIDCSALPAIGREWEPTFVSQKDEAGTARQASALRVPRGHRRFTWRLAPAAKKTALNAGRSDEPLYAKLDSITFMRSSPIENVAFVAQLKKATDQADALPKPLSRLPTWIPGGAAPTELTDLGTALANYRAAAASRTNVVAAAGKVVDELMGLPDRIKTGDLKPYADEATKAAQGLSELRKFAKNAPIRCEKLVDDLLGSLKRKELLILDSLSAWENQADNLIPKPGHAIDLARLKTDLTDGAVAAIRPALSGVSTDRLGLGNSVEAARSIIRDLESDVQLVERAFDDKLGEFHRQYDDAKPWSEGRIGSFLDKIDAERAGLLNEIASAVAETQHRLGTELDDLSSKVGAVVSEALTAIGTTGSTFQKALESAHDALERALDTAIANIDKLLAGTTFQNADKKLDEYAAKYPKYAARVATAKALLADVAARLQQARADLFKLKNTAGAGQADFIQFIQAATSAVNATVARFGETTQEFIAIAGDAANDGMVQGQRDAETLIIWARQQIGRTVTEFASAGAVLDGVVAATEDEVRDAFKAEIFDRINGLLALASEVGASIADKVAKLESELGTEGLIKILRAKLIEPVVERLFARLTDADLNPYGEAEYRRLKALVGQFAETARSEIKSLSDSAVADARKKLEAACETLGGGLATAMDRLETLGEGLIADAQRQFDELKALVDQNKVQELIDLAKNFDRDIRTISNDLASSYSAAKGYAEKVIDSVGNLGSGGLAAAPSNILKLYAAAASAPDLPNLDFARERLGYYYKELNEVIDTTQVEAWFGRLGDELKALGISLPFNKLSDRLLPDDLSSLDIGRVFKNFGGLKLDQLFKGYKLPKGAKDAIKLTHAFDKKLLRAWVQVDVDVPIAGRKSLFSIGPFQLDFVDSRFVGQVRLEASKDNDKVEQSGSAYVATNIEAVVAGQTMVALRKVAVRFERSSGLKVDFDPKNIKLNPTFQFVQDTLGSIFPDEIGGLNLIKQNGIPVGVEHEFSMPPIDLMFATSGISNIQISNRFALVAYPDFVISDRLCLSKPELPFLFSIFIIGGTGYITVNTEYRPFAKEKGLLVVVEAAAGGSAALGFSFGCISGSVFITLSIALAYQKLLGTATGSGLTVSLVLLVAGQVRVAGLVTVYIGLLLRISYRDNGQVDATGTLTITIRISRFFKITARANVQYKLRGGRSESVTSTSAGAEITDKRLQAAKDNAEKLLKARG